VILELRATAVWARTELDFNILIDMIGLVPEGTRMSPLASGPLRRYDALFFFNPERSSLTMGPTLGGLERLFELGNTLCFDFQLLVQGSVFGPEGLQFGRHLG
jgi:hypothetical protein